MVPKNDQIKRFKQQFLTDKMGSRYGQSHQCHVDGSFLEALQQYRCDLFHHVDLDFREFEGEAGQPARQEIGAMVGIAPTATLPRSRPAISSISCVASSTSRRMASARGRKVWPNDVSRTVRPRRSNNLAPSSSSSLRTCCESDGWARCSCSAARVKLPALATAQKYRS
jgi:hypothetical protein